MIPRKSNNIWDFATDHPYIFGGLIYCAIKGTVDIVNYLTSIPKYKNVTLNVDKNVNEDDPSGSLEESSEV